VGSVVLVQRSRGCPLDYIQVGAVRAEAQAADLRYKLRQGGLQRKGRYIKYIHPGMGIDVAANSKVGVAYSCGVDGDERGARLQCGSEIAGIVQAIAIAAAGPATHQQVFPIRRGNGKRWIAGIVWACQ